MTQTQEQNVPALRFPEFRGGWETAPILNRLSKVIDYRGKAPPKSESGVPLITARNVRMGHLDFTVNEYIEADQYDTWMTRGFPKPNDVLFTTEAPLGNVALYPSKGTYAVGQRIITLQTDAEKYSSTFLYQALLGPILQRKVDSRGTGSTAKGIKSKLFVKIPYATPTLPEQQKIAAFLSSVDRKIAQLGQKEALLQRYKKGMMQKLFSQELRFKDAQGQDFPDWEEKRLGDLYEFKSTNSFSRDKLNYDGGSVRNIHYGDIHTKFKPAFDLKKENVPFINSDMDLSRISEDKYCQNGDLVIADASEDYDDIGKTIELSNLNNEKVLAGLHTLLARLVSNDIHIGFGAYIMACAPVRKQIKIIAQGTKVLGISAGRMAKVKLPIPDPDEQQKIAGFLSSIDRKIDLVSTELDHAKAFKKGLLQQMFI